MNWIAGRSGTTRLTGRALYVVMMMMKRAMVRAVKAAILEPRGILPLRKVSLIGESRSVAVTPPVGVKIDQLGVMRFQMRLLPRRRVDVVPARMRGGRSVVTEVQVGGAAPSNGQETIISADETTKITNKITEATSITIPAWKGVAGIETWLYDWIDVMEIAGSRVDRLQRGWMLELLDKDNDIE